MSIREEKREQTANMKVFLSGDPVRVPCPTPRICLTEQSDPIFFPGQLRIAALNIQPGKNCKRMPENYGKKGGPGLTGKALFSSYP
jgi:hypothetical protein